MNTVIDGRREAVLMFLSFISTNPEKRVIRRDCGLTDHEIEMYGEELTRKLKPALKMVKRKDMYIRLLIEKSGVFDDGGTMIISLNDNEFDYLCYVLEEEGCGLNEYQKTIFARSLVV